MSTPSWKLFPLGPNFEVNFPLRGQTKPFFPLPLGLSFRGGFKIAFEGVMISTGSCIVAPGMKIL